MDRRLRIGLDTNVLVSAAIKPEGQQAFVVYLVCLGEHKPNKNTRISTGRQLIDLITSGQ